MNEKLINSYRNDFIQEHSVEVFIQGKELVVESPQLASKVQARNLSQSDALRPTDSKKVPQKTSNLINNPKTEDVMLSNEVANANEPLIETLVQSSSAENILFITNDIGADSKTAEKELSTKMAQATKLSVDAINGESLLFSDVANLAGKYTYLFNLSDLMFDDKVVELAPLSKIMNDPEVKKTVWFKMKKVLKI